MGWGGRWEEGSSRAGACSHLWLTHVDTWQKPSQYCNYPPIKDKVLKIKVRHKSPLPILPLVQKIIALTAPEEKALCTSIRPSTSPLTGDQGPFSCQWKRQLARRGLLRAWHILPGGAVTCWASGRPSEPPSSSTYSSWMSSTSRFTDLLIYISWSPDFVFVWPNEAKWLGQISKMQVLVCKCKAVFWNLVWRVSVGS